MSATQNVIVHNGGLYLSRALCGIYFNGLEGVVLLREADDLLILPVRHAAAGGYLLKIRNGAGDRVVTAPDFFRRQGVSDADEHCLPVRWDSARASLLAPGAFDVLT